MATIPVTVSHIFEATNAAAAEALITQGYELTPADEALLEIGLPEGETAGVEELLSHRDRERLFWRVKASLGGAKLFAEGDWAAQVLATLHPSVPLAKMSPSQVPSFAGLESIATQPGESSQCTNEGYKIAAAGAGGTNGGEDSLVGKKLGNYLILSELGTGGMATVYEAFHEGLNKKVAIKVVSPEFANDPHFRERFKREVQMTKKVVHPHVVEYESVDVDPATNSFYLVVEYLDGKTLEDTLKKAKPLPWERARDILLQISDGLEAIHRAGIIHRDLKPGNIMLIERDGKEDFVKIVDLGIAKPSSKAMEQKLTQDGRTRGTPHYMSPEQGMAKELDHRSDLYSLGIMMYEMLTGGLPFDGETPDSVVIKHVTEQPLPPSKKNPGAGISRAMDAVILRALEKEPANRFQSAGEMAEAISAIAGGGKKEEGMGQRPEVSRPGEPAPPAIRASDVIERFSVGSQEGVTGIKNPFPWRGVGVASALLAVGLGGFFLGRREKATTEKPEGEPPAKIEKPEPEPKPEKKARGISLDLNFPYWLPEEYRRDDLPIEEILRRHKARRGGEVPISNRKFNVSVDGFKKLLGPKAQGQYETNCEGQLGPIGRGGSFTGNRYWDWVGQKNWQLNKIESTSDWAWCCHELHRVAGEIFKQKKINPPAETPPESKGAAPAEKTEPKTVDSKEEKALEMRIAGLIRQLDSDETVEKALNGLFEIGRPAVPVLIKALKEDEKENVRSHAANILGSMGNKSAVPALIKALNDESPSVRNIAANALGRIKDQSALPALEKALEDGDSNVRFSAAWALEYMKQSEGKSASDKE